MESTASKNDDFEQDYSHTLKEKVVYIALKPFRWLRAVFLITGVFVWCMLGIFIVLGYLMMSSIPDFEKLSFSEFRQNAKQSVVQKLEKKKTPVGWTTIDKINRGLLYAIVMGEDGSYFEHDGINYDALINAFAENIKRRKYAFGASTISQQTIKNVYLDSSKSFGRKLKEIIATKSMEKRFSKNQVLEIYLNIAEFGPDIFGVTSASKYYFNKRPSQINAAEGAFLALMLPSPRKYHHSIYKNKYLAARHKRKLRRILKDMVYKEYISPDQYRKYLKYSYF